MINIIMSWLKWGRLRLSRRAGKFAMAQLSDEAFAKQFYFNKLGKELNLNNPQTYLEKLHWINLYDRNPLMTVCADKYTVREYVTEKVGAEILIPLHDVFISADAINFAKLPKPCILKVNHGSGQNLIVNDSGIYRPKYLNIKAVSPRKAKRLLARYLSKSLYLYAREWVYKNISPKITCEQFLQDPLPDYKIHCFNGSPKYIQVIVDRGTSPTETFYDTDWKKTEMVMNFPPCLRDCPPPKCLQQMVDIARKLSADFNYVRVDLYDHSGQVLFGELTFMPAAGAAPPSSHEWDLKLGNMLKLPIDK